MKVNLVKTRESEFGWRRLTPKHRGPDRFHTYAERMPEREWCVWEEKQNPKKPRTVGDRPLSQGQTCCARPDGDLP